MEAHTKIGKYPFTNSEVAELREYFGEQIAKDIEDYLRNNIDIQPWVDVRNFRFCAKIARGIHNG